MHIPPGPGLSPFQILRKKRRPMPFPLNSRQGIFSCVAPNVIYRLFKHLELNSKDVVLVPDYHHGAEVGVMKATGARLQFYPIQTNLEMNVDEVLSLFRQYRPRALYVTHFLGWPQPLEEMRERCDREGTLLIEDCTLSFLSASGVRPLGSVGDYAVFSPSQTLPLPEGSVLASNVSGQRVTFGTEPPHSLSVLARGVELSLEWLRMCFGLLGKPQTETSELSYKLLDCFDYEAIKSVRQQNYRHLLNRIERYWPLLPISLTPDICPLFFPLPVQDKHAAAVEFRNHGIGAVEFWNHGDPDVDANPGTTFLRKHILGIPIHQDVTSRQIDYIHHVLHCGRMRPPTDELKRRAA